MCITESIERNGTCQLQTKRFIYLLSSWSCCNFQNHKKQNVLAHLNETIMFLPAISYFLSLFKTTHVHNFCKVILCNIFLLFVLIARRRQIGDGHSYHISCPYACSKTDQGGVIWMKVQLSRMGKFCCYVHSLARHYGREHSIEPF